MEISIKGIKVLIDDDDYLKISMQSWSRGFPESPYFRAHIKEGNHYIGIFFVQKKGKLWII